MIEGIDFILLLIFVMWHLLKKLIGIKKKEPISWLKEYQESERKLCLIKEELLELINTPTTNTEVFDILYKVRNIAYKID